MNMKKTSVLLLALLAVAIALPAGAGAKGSWTGWITDSTCGAKGAKAAHKNCAEKCLSEGGKLVFYSLENQKIYSLENQELAKQHLGHEVTVTGEVADGTYIKVESITATGK